MKFSQPNKYITTIDLKVGEFETLCKMMDYFRTGEVPDETELKIGNLETITIRKIRLKQPNEVSDIVEYNLIFELPETE